MKKILLLAAFLFLQLMSAQSLQLRTLWSGKTSIRAVELYQNKVYFAGSGGKFGYVNIKDTADRKILQLGESEREFRTLAQDGKYFYTINIESPAHFYRIDKSTLQFIKTYTDTAKAAFYDALLSHRGKLYTFSDPQPDLKLKLAYFSAQKPSAVSFFTQPALYEGEAAFAASNTNLAAYQNILWIATGGKKSRIIQLNTKTGAITSVEIPVIQGSSSQGLYTLDIFKNKFAVAAGGDYTKPEANINNIITSTDGGKSWQVQASGANAGYVTCVRIRPGSRGREIIAVGDKHISISRDFGKSWKKISAEKNLYTVKWLDSQTLVFAGKGRIMVGQLKD